MEYSVPAAVLTVDGIHPSAPHIQVLRSVPGAVAMMETGLVDNMWESAVCQQCKPHITQFKSRCTLPRGTNVVTLALCTSKVP